MNDLDFATRRGTQLRACGRLGAMAMLLAGCSGEMDVGDYLSDTAETGTVSQALRCTDGNEDPINDPNCPWKYWAPLSPTTDITHTMSPAICAKTTALTISVDTNGRYRTLQWHSVLASSWGNYGTRTFASNPTCAFREDSASGQPGFVLAGKGTDGKLYASPGTMAPAAIPQSNPTADAPWAAVSSTVYNTAGYPALAPSYSYRGDSVMLTFMGDDSRTIYAHVRDLPYTQNSWTSRITGPQLPSGWAVLGAPAVAKLPMTVQIVVYASNGSQERLFTTHFDGLGFSGGVPGSPASWQMLASVGDIDSAPSLTYSSPHGLTVYFRRDGQIMQTGGYPLGSTPVLAVKPDEGLSFASAPAGHFGWQYESQGGAHLVVARTTSNQLQRAENFPDSWLVP